MSALVTAALPCRTVAVQACAGRQSAGGARLRAGDWGVAPSDWTDARIIEYSIIMKMYDHILYHILDCRTSCARGRDAGWEGPDRRARRDTGSFRSGRCLVAFALSSGLFLCSLFD